VNSHRADAFGARVLRAGRNSRSWLGYKVNLSEADPATGRPPAPNLFISVTTTEANVPDAAMTAPTHHTLADAGLASGEHATDAGYTSADLPLGRTPPRRSPSTSTASRSPAPKAPPACPGTHASSAALTPSWSSSPQALAEHARPHDLRTRSTR